jgi:DNA-binding cell septation regulator SpoVG
MVTLTFNGVMRVNGCKVIEGSNGLFLSYPSEKRPGSDQYFQHAFVFCRDTQEEIQKQVLDKYRKTMELQ